MEKMLTVEENPIYRAGTVTSQDYGYHPRMHKSETCNSVHGDRYVVINTLGQIIGRFATSNFAMDYIEKHCPCDSCKDFRASWRN